MSQPVRRIKEGEMIWSVYFDEWIKVLEILPTGYFFFMKKGEILRSQEKITFFEQAEFIF